MYDKLKHVHVEETIEEEHFVVYCYVNGMTFSAVAEKKMGRINMYKMIADIAEKQIRRIMSGAERPF